MTYIGTEGYLVNCELLEGKQHLQKHISEFLKEAIRMCKERINMARTFWKAILKSVPSGQTLE